jgi:hypothetical protein
VNGTSPVDQSAAVPHEPLTGFFHESVHACALATEAVRAPRVKRQTRAKRVRVTMISPFGCSRSS